MERGGRMPESAPNSLRYEHLLWAAQTGHPQARKVRAGSSSDTLRGVWHRDVIFNSP